MHLHVGLYLFFYLFLYNANCISSSSEETDGYNLLLFSQGFYKGNAAFDTWVNGSLPCNDHWLHVSCSSSSSSRVTSLLVYQLSLVGTISSSLGGLDQLQVLYLFFNGITGTLPSQLGLLSNLTYISVSGNHITGSIPSDFGRLSSLQYAFLWENDLSGPLPSDIGRLSNLLEFDVDTNFITGSIPSDFVGLSNLYYLSLFGNDISGHFLAELSLPLLNHVDLHQNHLTGIIPTEIGLLSSITYMSFSNNRISGTIPSEIGHLSSLQILYLWLNSITGTLPTEFGLLSNQLLYIDIDNNLISGTIPTELGRLSLLQYLAIWLNRFGGTIPTELGKLSSLQHFDLDTNMLSGTIPSQIGLLSSLSMISLDRNELEGTLPTDFGRILSLKYLGFPDNQLSGSIPSEIGALTNLTQIAWNTNNFTSSLPSELGLLTKLVGIEIYYNRFTGHLPSGWSNFNRLTTFFATINNFNDSLPIAWQFLPSLHNLDISSSGLTCTLPICNVVYYWNAKTQADSVIIVSQPTIANSTFSVITTSAVVLISCYKCCAEIYCNCDEFGCCDSICLQAGFSTRILLPSFVVTATVNPAIAVKSVTGVSVGSIESIATFSALQFIGQPNVSYTITFSVRGLNPITSHSILLPPCSARRPNSIIDVIDSFSCVCDFGYYYATTENSCLPCPIDRYKNRSSSIVDSLGESACVSCPTSSGTAKLTAQTSISSCVCESGYFSTSAIEISTNGPDCRSCSVLKQAAVSCLGANISSDLSPLAQSGIDVSPNFWITSNTSYFHPKNDTWFFIAKCPTLSIFCSGGVGEEKCDVGYTGPVCGICDDDYASLTPFQCTKCPSKAISRLLATIIVFVIIIACVLVVYFSQPSKMNSESNFMFINSILSRIDKIGLKLAITHLQIISFAGNFNITWSTVLVKVFTLPASAATLTSSLDNIAINCATNPSFYSKAILYFFAPFIFAVGVFAGFVIYYYISNKQLFSPSFFLHVRQGTIALLYVAHPGIVQGLMKSIQCYDVGLQSLAVGDMNISCNSSSFKTLEAFASIYLVIYGAGGLIAVYLLLKRITTDATVGADIKASFSFLVAGYSNEMNYWDLIVTAKKIIIAVISIFASSSLQLIFTLWVLLISGSVLRHFKPYLSKRHKRMEVISTWVIVFTVTVGMMFYTNVLDPNSNDGVAVSLFLVTINFLCIVILLFASMKFTKSLFKPRAQKKKTATTTAIIHDVDDDNDIDDDENEIENENRPHSSTTTKTTILKPLLLSNN